MRGKLESIEEIKELKSGTGKKGPWTLFGTHLKVDGQDYGMTSFKRTELQDKISKLKTGSVLEFDTEQSGDYTNLKQGAEIKVISEGTGEPGATTPAPKPVILTDEEIEKVWDETADHVLGYLKEKKVVADGGYADIGPSINTIFMKKMEERRRPK